MEAKSGKTNGSSISKTKLDRIENKKRKMAALHNLVKDNDSYKKIKLDKAVNGPHNDVKSETNGDASSPSNEMLHTKKKYAKLKTYLKEKKNKPKVRLRAAGEYSSLSTSSEIRTPIFMSDVRSMQNFLLTSMGNQSRWAAVDNFQHLSQIMMVIVEGISLKDLMTAAGEGDGDQTLDETANGKKTSKSTESKQDPKWLLDILPRTSALMQYKLELLAPSMYQQSPCQELLNVPLPKKEKEKLMKKYHSLKSAEKDGLVYKTVTNLFPFADPKNKRILEELEEKVHFISRGDKFDRRQLVLSPQDMYKHGFPVPFPGCPGFKDPEYTYTHENYDTLKSTSPMFGIDCEMCLTTTRELELTMVSVINEDLQLIYHTLVKPPNAIINYLTKYSGIKPHMLVGVTTTLKQVQKELRKLLPPDAILVGHSLNSDFKALKIMHPYVVDSSLVYNLTGERHKRSSLKNLTKMFLKKEIQESKEGHDPTEDAGASLELVQLKLKHDLKFGDIISGGNIEQDMEESLKDAEREKEKYKVDEVFTSNTNDCPYARSMFQVSKDKHTALVTTPIGLRNYQELFSQQAAWCPHLEVVEGNKHVSKKVVQLAKEKDVIYAHIPMNSHSVKCKTLEEKRKSLQKLDMRLARICSSAPAKTWISIIFTGSPLGVALEQCSNGLIMCAITKGTS